MPKCAAVEHPVRSERLGTSSSAQCSGSPRKSQRRDSRYTAESIPSREGTCRCSVRATRELDTRCRLDCRSLKEALEAYHCNLTQDVPIVQEIRNEVRKLNSKDVIWQKITKLERDLRFTADMERLIAPSTDQVSKLEVSKTLFCAFVASSSFSRGSSQ